MGESYKTSIRPAGTFSLGEGRKTSIRPAGTFSLGEGRKSPIRPAGTFSLGEGRKSPIRAYCIMNSRGTMFHLLNCLGYELNDEQDRSRFIDMATSRLSVLQIGAWEYLSYRSKQGPEVYFGKEILAKANSFSVHFHSFTSQELLLTERLPDPESAPEGLFEARTANGENLYYGEDGAEGEGERQHTTRDSMPLVFKPPNFHWYDHISLAARAQVQLAAFPKEIELIQPGSAFPMPGKESEQKLRFFASPIGVHLVEKGVFHPILEFGGMITALSVYTNELSKKLVYVATVQTVGLTMDVLIPVDMTPLAPAPGMLVRAICWLTGRIKEVYPAEPQENALSWVFLQQTRAAGTFYHDLGEKKPMLGFWDELTLQREPDNAYDPRAVAILTSDGDMLGYIPRDRNQDIAALLDAGEQMQARLIFKFLQDSSQEYILRVYTRSSIRL